MDKYKKVYKRLRIAFWTEIACYLFPMIADKGLMDNILIGLVLIWIAAHLTYLVSLGTLAAGANKSVIMWVGGTMITGPIGFVVSFIRMKSVAIRQGWD